MSKLVKLYQPLYAYKNKGPWYPLGTFLSKEEAKKVDLKDKGLFHYMDGQQDGFVQELNAVEIDGQYYLLEDKFAKIPKPVKVQE